MVTITRQTDSIARESINTNISSNGMDTPWRIELFGGLQMTQRGHTVNRFQTAKTGALLAYLALQSPRSVNREHLADMIWADAEPISARNSLRVALNSLRRQLEMPGVPPGAVLVADRIAVSLSPNACTTDVSEFENLMRRERQAPDTETRIDLMRKAVALYRGDLLAGWSEPWLIADRTRLSEACLLVIKQLVRHFATANDYDTSLEYARRAIILDPLREGAHRDLMRLYAALGRPAAALRQYEELERILRIESQTRPSENTQQLAAQIGDSTAHSSLDALAHVQSQIGIDDPSAQITVIPVTSSSTMTTVASPVGAERENSGIPTGILPIQFTRFFGRDEEMSSLLDLLMPTKTESQRFIVALTGAAGVGKTRLAVEAGYRLRPAYENRVWFISLADVEEISRLPLAIANGLHLPALNEGDPVEQIIALLSESPALLILDNFEQLMERAAEEGASGDKGTALLHELLVRIPRLRLVLTTRNRLNIDGEREITILPMPTPQDEALPHELTAYPSIALFVDRAQAVRPDFQITPNNAPAIAALCKRLEGIPLAIELAAAWATALTPAQMLERLTRRFDLLVSRKRDRTARHITLRAALDYSYELLPPHLKRFFRQMSVFRGGISLEAAEEISESMDALEMLLQLQQRSLILTEEVGAAMRFRMLETLREYGWERLTVDEQKHLEAAHTDCFVRFADTAHGEMNGAESLLWLRALETEQENLRIALEHLLKTGDAIAALRLTGTLWRYWYSHGYVDEGAQYLERSLLIAGSDAPPPLRAEALEGAGRLASAKGDYMGALAFLEERLAIVRNFGDGDAMETTLFNLCLSHHDAGDKDQAQFYLSELLQRKRAESDRWQIACMVHALADATEDGDAATLLQTEALQLHRALGTVWNAAEILDALAEECAKSDPQRAETLRAEVERLQETLGDEANFGISYLNLGYMALQQGDYSAARDLLCDALDIFREMGSREYTAVILENLANTAKRQNDRAGMRDYLSHALRLRRELDDRDGIAFCQQRLAAVG